MDIKQTWDEFKKKVVGKKLFVFGIGNGSNYFFSKCTDEYRVQGVIDNDKTKQGVEFSLFFDGELSSAYREMKVSNISILDTYVAENVVVLITSLVHYDEIRKQLIEKGIEYIYILQIMGIKREEKNPILIKDKDYSIIQNKILIYSVHGYCGHGKYIAKELLKRNPNLDVVWITDNMKIEVNDSIRLLYVKNKEKYREELESARLWIYDNPIPMFAEKKEGQIYIQVKHWSSITLKTFGLDVARVQNSKEAVEIYKHDSEAIDYLVIGSNFDLRTCRKGFGYKGKILDIGSPRSDCLFYESDAKKIVYERYNIKKNRHLVLYAPTFRERKSKEKKDWLPDVLLNVKQLKKELEKRYGGNWNIMLRLHPLCKIYYGGYITSDDVIDVSDYGDSQELVAAADLVITDYSSIMFEPAFVKKPAFLFAPDRDEYVKDRDFLIPYDTLPFSIAKTNEELIENICNFEYEEYNSRVSKFFEQYGVHEDGHASERAADFILSLFEKE